jgi:hypothetical protein
MHTITMSFPCPTGRFLGAFTVIRRDLRAFPEKIFSSYPPLHEEKYESASLLTMERVIAPDLLFISVLAS